MLVTLPGAPADLPRLRRMAPVGSSRSRTAAGAAHPRPRSSSLAGGVPGRDPRPVGRARRRPCCASPGGSARTPSRAPGSRSSWPHAGRHRGAPALHAADVADLPPAGVPGARPFVRGAHARRRRPDGWDVRQRHAGTDPAALHEADPRRPGERRHLDLAGRRRGRTASPTCRAVLDGVLPRPRPRRARRRRARRRRAAAEAFLELAAERGVADADLLGHPRVSTRSGVRPAPATGAGRRRRSSRSPCGSPSEHPQVRRRRRRRRCRCTPPAARTPRSSASRWPPGVAYLRALPTPGSTSRPRPGCWSSATPPPPSSSRRSRSCAPPAGCGRACWRPAAPAATDRSASTPSRSPTMLTRRDPYVNLLRGTIAGFAAGVGGADAVTVAPFDAALGASDAVLPADRAQHPGAADRGGAPGAG